MSLASSSGACNKTRPAQHSRVQRREESVSSHSTSSQAPLVRDDDAAAAFQPIALSSSTRGHSKDTMSLRGKLETCADTAKTWAGGA